MGGGQTSGVAQSGPPCDLAGTWIPTRHGEWKNRNIGMAHSTRARMPNTSMTYKANGKGEGWVGELYVYIQATQLAPGQCSATAKIIMPPWRGNDGNLTVLDDGTLQVRYPSNGIVEYWARSDGRSRAILNEARRSWGTARANEAADRHRQARPIRVVFRRVDALGIMWHWGLAVGESIYEVGGTMAVIGPTGLIHATGPIFSKALGGTKLAQFEGYVEMRDKTTCKTDDEITQFCRDWVRRHPMYNAAGPNCQTLTEDLYVHLTGENLAFAKIADLQQGPEASASAVWLKRRTDG